MSIFFGYIFKFNNGVLLQWGKILSSPQLITLPCAYINGYVPQVTTYGWEYSCIYYNDTLTLTTFMPYNVFYQQNRVSDGAVLWMTIGS